MRWERARNIKYKTTVVDWPTVLNIYLPSAYEDRLEHELLEYWLAGFDDHESKPAILDVLLS